ncbi:MAG: hypothetical protein HC822_25885 [Oscillochloris sp.]|nr:hypothetical protein [Oscillochloris sp.]
MDRQAREVIVTLEQAGVVIAEQTVAVRPRLGERLLGIVAPAPPTLRLPLREDLSDLPFLPFALTPADLPSHPAGLSSLDLLLLNNVPTEQLRPDQIDTLHAWVRSGGHLFLGGGPGAAALLAGLPAVLHPAEPGATAALNPAPLEAYVDSASPPALEGIMLTPLPDAQAFGDAAAPLWVSRAVGLGQVTQLAFDPGLNALVDWPAAPAFWDRLLRSPAIYGTVSGRSYSPDLIREQTMAIALGYLPAVNLPQSDLLFVLLALYAILIGPGMALLLRRLDRQTLGWIALPAVAGVVLLAGSGLAVSQRADQRIVSQVMLVEQIDADTARVRATLGLLSPQDAIFTVNLPPDAVTRPIQPGSSRYGPIAQAGGDFSQDTGEMNLAIDRWEIQGVLVEDLAQIPALDAQIRLTATQIEAIVRNPTTILMRDVTVVYAEQAVLLGDIPAGGEAQAAWPVGPPIGEPRPNANTPVSVLTLGEALTAGREAGGQLERRVQIQEALINAAVGRGSAPEASGPFVFAWLESDPIGLTVDAEGAASQQVALLAGRAQIGGSGRIVVPAGWMRLQPSVDNRQFCRGDLGRGLSASPVPVIFDFALPADLAALQPTDLTINLQSERTWPNAGVRTAIYNWDSDSWDEIRNFDGPGLIFITQNAANYLAGGRLRLRLDGRISEAGCVFADLQLSGTLP